MVLTNGKATIGTNIVTAGDLAGGDFTSGTFNLLNKNLYASTGVKTYNVTLAGGEDAGTDQQQATNINRILNLGNNNTSVVIPGNLLVQGSNTILETGTDDDIIQLRKSATTEMTNYAGLVATKYDGTNDGALV